MNDFLNRLNAFNNTPKKVEDKPIENIEPKKTTRSSNRNAKTSNNPKPVKKPVEIQKPKVTFVMTACGRPDLMEKTLDSFFKLNSYPIERFIITEDSADPKIFEECKAINSKKYNNKLEFVFNEKKLGQARSIDLAYSMVDTEYIFHCEEDWEFYRSQFIEKSLKVLESDKSVLQAWIRPKSDKILNRINEEVYNINGVGVRNVLPVSFKVSGSGANNKDLIVNNYMGFSWNPGLKRISDYKLLKNGYSGFQAEHLIDGFYRAHKNKYKVVSISINDDYGFVKHIGWGRRADEPILSKKKVQPIKNAISEQKLKREEKINTMKEQISIEKEQQVNKVPVVSLVMQSYLGDYPGSRKNPVAKFHRIINAFLTQPYYKSELIIVSDGCEITHEEYYKVYKNNPRIKYAYVAKPGVNMYEEVDGKKQYRGIPRRIGVSLCEGDVISYIDTDDLITPTFVTKIAARYVKEPSAMWYLNQEWYDHTNVFHPNWIAANGVGNSIMPHDKEEVIKLSETVSIVPTKMKDGFVVSTPWLFAHRAECDIKWNDTEFPISEDVDFSRRLRDKYPSGVTYRDPSYIRCHYKGAWDF